LVKPHGLDLANVYDHYAQEVVPFLGAPTVAEIVAKLIQSVASNGRRESTIDSLKSILGDFSRYFGNVRITNINLEDLEQFCFRPGLTEGNSPGTKRLRWAKVCQLYNFAMKRDWATKNLALKLDAPPLDDDREPSILTIDEVENLLKVGDEFGFLPYFILAIFLGIRPNEIRRLSWTDVHFEDGVVVVKKAAAKIHERREIPINETAAAWLALCRRSDGPIVEPKDFGKRFKAARKAAGIKHWTKDVMRHCYATYSVAADKNPAKTAMDMGHISGLRILRKHYVAYVPESVAKEFWAIRPKVAPVAAVAAAAA
jgi:integrase